MVRTDDDRLSALYDSLADRSPKLADAFLEAAPLVAQKIGATKLDEWAALGRRLGRGGWSTVGMAARFFSSSPALLDVASLAQVDRLVTVVSRLASLAPDVASSYVRDAPSALARVDPEDREAFVSLVGAVADRSWADSDRCLEATPEILEPLAPTVRTPVLVIAAEAVTQTGPGAFGLFAVAARGLATLATVDQIEIVAEASALCDSTPDVALEMLASAPDVAERLTADQAARWREAGRELLSDPAGDQRANSWFRLESAQANDLLAALAGRVDLSDVVGVLRPYAQALSGHDLILQASDALARRNIGWTISSRATCDGVSIYLPASIGKFKDHESNFNAYKVHTTLQAARMSCGSFELEIGRDGTAPPDSIPSATPDPGHVGATLPTGRTPRSAMRAFYESFDDRRLIAWLFALVEGVRVDAWVGDEYPGIRPHMRQLKEAELVDRPRLGSLPERQAFAERLVLSALGRDDLARAGTPHSSLCEALDTLDAVRATSATVQDSASVAAALYAMLDEVPNVVPALPGQDARPTGGDVPFEVPDQPEHLGDFKPELVQTIDLLDRAAGADATSITREELMELLSESVELDLDGEPLDRAQLDALLDNLEEEAVARTSLQPDLLTDSDLEDSEDSDPEPEPAAEEASEPGASGKVSWFRYDEWDFHAHDYLTSYCRLGERRAEEGDLDSYTETLKRHSHLAAETRRRFEQLRPEAFRRINRLEDGSDIDLDEAVQFHADKLAGAGPLPRFYTRRNKVVRDVAVGLLLDMSASTKDPAGDGSTRVIDVEKDATVLMIEALQAIGDTYGIYGFSGAGHEEVEFHSIKELDEPLDDDVRRRVAGIEPIGATRMGTAIRHTIAKLDAYPAKVKILMMVSDGRPQDEDYGPDRGQIDYALHDTRKALTEARHNHIEPFLITVDSEGQEYLGQMCGDIGYEVVADVESLPRRLPRLYRHLARD